MGTSTEPVVTYVLIGINVAVALGSILGGGDATGGVSGSSKPSSIALLSQPAGLRRFFWWGRALA